MSIRRESLPELVDSFGRTADAEFDFGAVMGFLESQLDRVDEAEAYKLVCGSNYVFEVLENPSLTLFLPRRMFFQGAEFRIVPSREEVEGGVLFPGHHFAPFVSREVFPGDLWLVLPDGAAPHVRRISIPQQSAMESLSLFGEVQSLEYLISDEIGAEDLAGEVSVSAYDLRDFYTENSFKPGDSLMVRVLDWLQGVFAVSCVPANQPADAGDLDDWTLAMRAAYDRMQVELGTEGDCYEQLAVMMLLAQETDRFPVMKSPPQSIPGFIREQDDIIISSLADRAMLCTLNEDVQMSELDDLMSPLDGFFKELGVSCSEAEAEAYMQDARFHGLDDPDAVLARVVKARALVFKSADDQEEFHALWSKLWGDVEDFYSRDLDRFGMLRSDLLLLKDQCVSIVHRMDGREVDPLELSQDQDFLDFSNLSALLPGLFALLNFVSDDLPGQSVENMEGIASMLLDRLPGILKKLEAK